ncbi:MAG TPA: aldo/keto reductase [Chthoniobacterales bacterium]|nr:aldo/keto reductase [Chthoniobacterales bacterium]
MKYRPLGKSGIEASVVGFGAWAIGGWMWGGTKKNDPEGAIRAAIDHGINLIDTAPMYGYGHSEELVGAALKGIRDQVVLATKCGMVWYKKEGDKFFDASDTGEAEGEGDKKYEVYINLRPAMIRYEIEESLRRLKTDRIDLYQTHWQDSTTRTEDVMAELLLLKQEGKIRAIGCSNATVGQMDRYRSIGQLDTDQEQYSMLQRQHEADNLSYCHDHHVAFLAYSPMALGILSGKIDPNHQFGEGDVRRGNPWYQKENRSKVDALLGVIRSVAEDKGITVAQTVIAWTLAQPGCTHALVGARNPDQAIANAKAGEVELTQDEVRIIRKVVDQTKL